MKKIFNSNVFLLAITLLLTSISCDLPSNREQKLLIFSKTATYSHKDFQYRHKSIEKGVEAVKKLCEDRGIRVVHTEDASKFNEEFLSSFSAVCFLNTTGNVLDAYQQSAFERFIQAGGGFVGIHSAADTEHDWKWYGQMVGAYFDSHPEIQEAQIALLNKSHNLAKGLPNNWTRTDEWYNYKNLSDQINVLHQLDESSYKGGNHGGQHPISWYQEYDGGRSFYTGFGHTEESFQEPDFLKLLLNGIRYAIGPNKLDYSKATTKLVPEENRFIYNTLAENLDEPMELDIFPNGEIVFVERKGKIKTLDPEQGFVRTAAFLPVHTKHEDGLLGIAIDPNYEQNHWIYLFYSPPGEEPKQHVSRFVYRDDSLHFSTEKVILEIPVQRDECCHSAGSLEFAPDGNLFISVGDNTNPFASNGFAPIDERPGREPWDAQRSSGNTNDLRGKILRIHPEADGSYTIPEGNLFPEGTPNTRPEIYVMGCRNPFRPSIDSKRGFLFWGDVGPDAGKDNENRGPKGIDEINLAKKAGYWGWPYSRGNNQAYRDYNFETGEFGPSFNPDQPINDSPNNTGLRELPPIQKSMVWYSYDESKEFPWVGTGGKNPMAGPVYYSDQYHGSKKFPDYFDGKLIAYEWMRHWMYAIKIDSAGNFVKADPFMQHSEFSRPMDMIFGKDGCLYFIEYGNVWFAKNQDARISKIEFIKGNRQPIARLKSDKIIGGTPLTVHLDASGSADFDEDPLTYSWTIDGKKVADSGAMISHTFTTEGTHQVTLEVIDTKGLKSKVNQEIQVGNDPPIVHWDIEGNKSFYWANRPLNYEVVVSDKEDGEVSKAEADSKRVYVSFTYLNQGLDITEAAQGHTAGLEQAKLARGSKLIEQSDCKNCHALNKKVNGPSYFDIAKFYEGKPQAALKLAKKIITGGSGVWGETVMSAHPLLSEEESGAMAAYVLSLANQPEEPEAFPLRGVHRLNDHIGQGESGKYILLASYTDLGNGEIHPLTTQEQLILRHPRLQAEDANEKSRLLRKRTRNEDKETVLGSFRNKDYFGFNDVDLTEVSGLKLGMYFNNNALDSKVTVRLDSPDGEVIGEAVVDKLAISKKELFLPLEPQEGSQSIYFTFQISNGQSIGNANWVFFLINGKELAIK